LVTGVRVQTGVRVDSELWQTYRLLCRREKLRPSKPIEEFLRLMVDADSAVSVLSLMREATRSRVEGLEAYARVLLDWYTHGKFWFRVQGEEHEAPVEGQLLESLKLIADPDLRKLIEEALIAHQREAYEKKAGKY
jgi:hypothetical protein